MSVRGKKTTLKVVGAGTGGVDEMKASLNPAAIQFGLLRFAFGKGTFARTKLLFVHFSGDQVSGIKRARTNAKKSDAVALVGSTHAEYVIDHVDECAVDTIFTRMQKVFVSDDHSGTFSIASMKADYEAMILAAKMKALEAGEKHKRKTAIEMGAGLTGEKALLAVRELLGPFNWILFTPNASKVEFVNAGSMSVDEMREWLKEDQVYYGLLRMGFGTGKFRRTKWISVWWTGDKCSAVKRGKLAGLETEMLARVAPYSLTVRASHLEDLTLDVVIDKVRRATVVDGDDVKSEEDPFSMEKFLQALKEEMEANKAFFPEDSGESASGPRDFDATVRDIRSDDGPLTWGLFEVDE